MRKLILLAALTLAACSGTRQQRNFETLCDHPQLTCIETAAGWSFEGPSRLIEQVCDTETTGMVCED